MKKLFISCPMKGRTEENIRASMEKMHKIAELICGEELEVIDSYIEHKPPENAQQSIWYLGESIKKLAEADVYVGLSWSDLFWNGCDVERDVAQRYGIEKRIFLPEEIWSVVMPDAWNLYRKRWEEIGITPVRLEDASAT